MKSLVFVFAAFLAVSFSACGNKATNAETATKAESTVVTEGNACKAACDSAKAEACKASCDSAKAQACKSNCESKKAQDCNSDCKSAEKKACKSHCKK